MSELWRTISIGGGDLLFGGLLSYGQDTSLAGLGLTTLIVFVVARRALIDRSQWHAVQQDIRRLKLLIREAKPEVRREDVSRYRRTRGRVAFEKLRIEWKAQVLTLTVMAMLVTWANHRLMYCPLLEGREFVVRLQGPPSSTGTIAHLIAPAGMESIRHENESHATWVRQLAADPKSPRYAVAEWRLQVVTIGDDAAPLVFKTDAQTLTHGGVATGQPRFVPYGFVPYLFVSYQFVPRQSHGDLWATEVELRPYHPFGFVPGLPLLGLAPWAVGYTLIVVPLLLMAWRRELRNL